MKTGVQVINELFSKLKDESLVRTFGKPSVTDGFFLDKKDLYTVIVRVNEILSAEIESALIYTTLSKHDFWDVKNIEENKFPIIPFNRPILPYGEIVSYKQYYSRNLSHKTPESKIYNEVPRKFIIGKYLYDDSLVAYLLQKIENNIRLCSILKV